MEYQTIKYTVEDNIARIAFDDAATLNACGTDTAIEIKTALGFAQTQARAIILTGEGPGFCSGANLGAERVLDPITGKPDLGASLTTYYNPLIQAFADCRIPIISAINGPTAGIGCSIALMGDIIIASEKAFFLLAFRNIGLVPDGGVTWLLPRLIGRHRAMEMALLGERLYADKAYEWGLVNKVVAAEQLETEALTIAQKLATGPSVALGLARQLINSADDCSFASALHAERLAQKQCGQTEDCVEGGLAFHEKRPANFKGR